MQISDSERVVFLRCLVAGGMLVGLGLSHKAWAGAERTFPLTPVIPGLILPAPLDALLFGALCLSLAAMIFSKRTKLFAAILLGLLIFICLYDQERWQPWCYQYAFFLGALGFYNPESESSIYAALNACRLVLCSTYFWSGLEKLNVQFMLKELPWLIGARPPDNVLPEAQYPVFMAMGTGIALLESMIAVGLLFKRTRIAAIVLCIIMHLDILNLLNGRSFNIVVWPWNIAMAGAVVLLFWNVEISWKDVLLPKSLWHGLVLVMCSIIPALCFAGIWDPYPSFALYAGDIPDALLTMSAKDRSVLPAKIQGYCKQQKDGTYILPFMDWSYADINLPCYPAVRVYKQIGEQMRKYFKEDSTVFLEIIQHPKFQQDTISRTLLKE